MGSGRNLDSKITQAWCMGKTGQNVLVAVVDDGVWSRHRDLKDAVNLDKSYDYQRNWAGSSDPGNLWSDNHGTSAAGIIAAAPNGVCGVGVAPGAKIAGIRLYGDNPTTDLMEANALTSSMYDVSIYSCSWGSARTGFDLKPLGARAAEALQRGATQGRGGRGSIYVFASGNGGSNGDSCAYDGFANSIYTIPISGVTADGEMMSSGEQCGAIMATTFTRDSSKDWTPNRIITPGTTGRSSCTSDFGETSAAAPLAAGIIALALEANPRLSARDVQHLIAETANNNFGRGNLWSWNAAGKKVSRAFGFGLLDAEKMVRYAEKWRSVPTLKSCEATLRNINRTIPGTVTLNLPSWKCSVNHVEHVQLYVLTKFTKRGFVKVNLRSPSRTESVMIPGRPNDQWSAYLELTVSSVQFWGERGTGWWEVVIDSLYPNQGHSGTVYDVKLVVYGTQQSPPRQTPSSVNSGCANQQQVTLPPATKPTVKPTQPPVTQLPVTSPSCSCKTLTNPSWGSNLKVQLQQGSEIYEIQCPQNIVSSDIMIDCQMKKKTYTVQGSSCGCDFSRWSYNGASWWVTVGGEKFLISCTISSPWTMVSYPCRGIRNSSPLIG
ncbi:endoprotease bli-4-like [Lingula anatina]|uniref:Endoprotease bli-4-like n=1 Tax=Lingula anatina TaxID=7574 RepID=A0A1S3JP78_LINAN|nr:endoprotease bli-4-like [Lingula anatina]|eukprot:XP_013412170.1 endoprotease bli-4-like [Lingula anatina]